MPTSARSAIDPATDYAFWLELARDTYARGHHRIATEILAEARNEYAALRTASSHCPLVQATNQPPGYAEKGQAYSTKDAFSLNRKPASGKLVRSTPMPEAAELTLDIIDAWAATQEPTAYAGVPTNVHICPVAYYLENHRCTDIEVTETTISFYDQYNRWAVLDTPHDIEALIERVDHTMAPVITMAQLRTIIADIQRSGHDQP